jgi:hypothetical protein
MSTKKQLKSVKTPPIVEHYLVFDVYCLEVVNRLGPNLRTRWVGSIKQIITHFIHNIVHIPHINELLNSCPAKQQMQHQTAIFTK